MKSMMVARNMLEMWMLAEIRDEIPSPSEVCETVSKGFQDNDEEVNDDDVRHIVTEKLMKAALEMWNVEQSPDYVVAVQIGKDGKCKGF